MDPHQALAELKSTNCACGSSKDSMKSFCSTCYYKLPPHMRKHLYRRIGDGYEAAYEAAMEQLEFDRDETSGYGW